MCEQKDTWATQNASSLMADPLEAPSDMTLDLTLYAAMRAKSRSRMALAVDKGSDRDGEDEEGGNAEHDLDNSVEGGG